MGVEGRGGVGLQAPATWLIRRHTRAGTNRQISIKMTVSGILGWMFNE